MKLFLAPIQGMTTTNYRNQYANIFGGIDAYYAPFLETTNMSKMDHSIIKDILPENNNDINVTPQLLGNNGPDFNFFAKTLVDFGYKEINWNIGCPFPMVTNKKKGSGILPYPDMIKEFLDVVCKNNSYNLSVKMRLGLISIEEGIRVIDILNDYPISNVIIHGRTGKQKYSGTVDLDSFETLYLSSKHEVTYNGDIFSHEDFKMIQTRFPTINHFMLGRGALKDPFLASRIKGIHISHNEKIEKIKEFHNSIYSYYKNTLSGDKHLLDKMKEFWMYSSIHLDSNGKYFKKIKKCNTVASYLQIVNQMLNSSNTWADSL
ncbi:MAG: tRNA-dihydrouridine synthase family protein [Clostridiales bacterium]|nr:tRNA-dihydrouridine synthase family protein [Clostridiales bacterium]